MFVEYWERIELVGTKSWYFYAAGFLVLTQTRFATFLHPKLDSGVKSSICLLDFPHKHE